MSDRNLKIYEANSNKDLRNNVENINPKLQFCLFIIEARKFFLSSHFLFLILITLYCHSLFKSVERKPQQNVFLHKLHTQEVSNE